MNEWKGNTLIPGEILLLSIPKIVTIPFYKELQRNLGACIVGHALSSNQEKMGQFGKHNPGHLVCNQQILVEMNFKLNRSLRFQTSIY